MIGWVHISRREVARAEQALLGEGKGVRDEIGLLSIHQAIADRLFPGTSVLHTRLRYALFVPWLMRRAAQQASRSHIIALRNLELELTGQLVSGVTDDGFAQKGIIGGRVYKASGSPAAQPPSFSYWTALSTWHIISAGGPQTAMSRDQVMRVLHEASRNGRDQAKDELGDPIAAGAALFAGLPDEPDDLLEKSAPMSFALTHAERIYLRNRLLTVRRPDGGSSLLAGLAKKKAGLDAEMPWNDEGVISVADECDRAVLHFACGISALAGIARGLYLAMVEDVCRKEGLLETRIHWDRLGQLVAEYGKAARKLRLDERPPGDVGLGDPKLVALLRETQEWIADPLDLQPLKSIYTDAERRRKQKRARLALTEDGARRRRDWVRYEGTALADRLHFRWPNVKRMLNDLHARSLR